MISMSKAILISLVILVTFGTRLFAQTTDIEHLQQLQEQLARIEPVFVQYVRKENLAGSESDVKRYLRKPALNEEECVLGVKGRRILYSYSRSRAGVTSIGTGIPFSFGETSEEVAIREAVLADYRRAGVNFDISQYGSKAFPPPEHETQTYAFDEVVLQRNSSWGQGVILRVDQIPPETNKSIDQGYLFSVGAERGELLGFRIGNQRSLREMLADFVTGTVVKPVEIDGQSCLSIVFGRLNSVTVSPELDYAIVERQLFEEKSGRPILRIRNRDFRKVGNFYLPFESVHEVFAPAWAPAELVSPLLSISMRVTHIRCDDVSDEIFQNIEFTSKSVVIDRSGEVEGKGAKVIQVPASPHQFADAAQRLGKRSKWRSLLIWTNIGAVVIMISIYIVRRSSRGSKGVDG